VIQDYEQQFNELILEFYPALRDYTNSGGTEDISNRLPLSSGYLSKSEFERKSSELPPEILKQEIKIWQKYKRRLKQWF
jgi:hypothetical protein